MAENKDNTMEYINQAREIMQKAIDTTSCGYCKMIVGDSKEILDKYMGIIDDLKYINGLQSTEKKYLNDIKEGIKETYAPQINTEVKHANNIPRLSLKELNPVNTIKDIMPGIIMSKGDRNNGNRRIFGRFIGGFLK